MAETAGHERSEYTASVLTGLRDLADRLGKIEQLSARQMREPTQAIAMYLAALADLLDSPAGGCGRLPGGGDLVP